MYFTSYLCTNLALDGFVVNEVPFLPVLLSSMLEAAIWLAWELSYKMHCKDTFKGFLGEHLLCLTIIVVIVIREFENLYIPC